MNVYSLCVVFVWTVFVSDVIYIYIYIYIQGYSK